MGLVAHTSGDTDRPSERGGSTGSPETETKTKTKVGRNMASMHDLTLAREILEIACRHSAGARIGRIVVEIGRLACASPEAVRFAFEVLRAGTDASGAELEIVRSPGRARCLDCSCEWEVDDWFPAACECGGSRVARTGGTDILVRELEIL